MKFGKLESVDDIDFSLPEDPQSTGLFLAHLENKDEPIDIRVGTTGWSSKEWVGTVYPSGAKPADFLYYYSRQFGTIELNTTHYRIPAEEVISKWKEESADDFKFCPKVPQRISHGKMLGTDGPLISQFCNSISGLNEKLGCCFMQLPPYFGFDRLNVLENFLNEWPVEIPISIELRHVSWFSSEDHMKSLGQILLPVKCGLVITDVAGRRDVLHNKITSENVLIRFVGNGLHPTDYSRIDEWMQRIKQWLASGLRHIHLFIHESKIVDVPTLANYTIEKLNELDGISIKPIETSGNLAPRVKKDSQLDLFS